MCSTQRDKTVRGVLSGIEKSETNQELLHIVAELLDKITAQPDEGKQCIFLKNYIVALSNSIFGDDFCSYLSFACR